MIDVFCQTTEVTYIQQVRLGQPVKTVELDTHEFVYYIISLKKGDYKALLDFANSAGKKTNLQGYLALLNKDGGDQKDMIKMNEIDVSYRKIASFSLKEDTTLIIRVENNSSGVNYLSFAQINDNELRPKQGEQPRG